MRRFGIDLGTTNTCIFCADFIPIPTIWDEEEDNFRLNPLTIQYKNTADMINPNLSSIMPSAIYARPCKNSKDSYDFYIGEVAINAAKQDDVTEIINTKRLLCREDPKTKIAYGLTAEDIAQKLLEGCKYSIERAYGKSKNVKYCITQPAAFGLFASRSIHEAGIKAKFENAEVQREPIAALLSFLYEELRSKESAEKLLKRQAENHNRLLTLTVDIGGGTTDVTIQEIQITGTRTPEQGIQTCTGYTVNFLNLVSDENAPVATANQEPAFGGYDFDRKIVHYIIQEWGRQYYDKTEEQIDWELPEIQKQIGYLYQRVRQYKDSLSAVSKEKEDVVYLNGQKVMTVWTAEKFYEWTQDLCASPHGEKENSKTVYGIIMDTIQRSGYHVEDIDCFFVTGGMSSYKPIRNMLTEKFKKLSENHILKFSSTPLYDIARGAAVCNCYFKVDMPQSILYADLMLDDPCGEPKVLVRKNTPLPVEGKLTHFMQLRNPLYLYIDVLCGDSTKDCHIKRLRSLKKKIPGNKVAKMGTPISVNYRIDEHQAMNIELTVHDTDCEYRVSLLNLINNVPLNRKDEKHE